MVTQNDAPVFRFEFESIGGRGELIVMVGDKGVATPLTGGQTRLLHVVLNAWDQDPPVPEAVRGLRTYARIAKAYAKHVGYHSEPAPGAIGKTMNRIQKRFNQAWRKAFPRRKPPQLFDRLGQRGARLAIEIPRERRRRRVVDVREEA